MKTTVEWRDRERVIKNSQMENEQHTREVKSADLAKFMEEEKMEWEGKGEH